MGASEGNSLGSATLFRAFLPLYFTHINQARLGHSSRGRVAWRLCVGSMRDLLGESSRRCPAIPTLGLACLLLDPADLALSACLLQGILTTLPFTLAVYMVRDFESRGGAPPSEATVGRLTGLLAAVFCAAQLVTSYPWGLISDRVGRKVGRSAALRGAPAQKNLTWPACAAEALHARLHMASKMQVPAGHSPCLPAALPMECPLFRRSAHGRPGRPSCRSHCAHRIAAAAGDGHRQHQLRAGRAGLWAGDVVWAGRGRACRGRRPERHHPGREGDAG